MRRFLAAAAAAAIWAAGVSAPAQGQITITPEYDPATPLTRAIQSAEEFRAKLNIGVYEDPRIVSPQRLREILAELDLRTRLGRRVVNIAIDPHTGYFVGIDEGSISYVGNLPDGSIIVSARGATGAFTRPSADHLVWARPDGTQLCFDAVDVGQSKAGMRVTLLIDRSGSMTSVMGQVIETTRRFLQELPPNAICTLVSFAGDWTEYTRPGGEPCGQVRVPGNIRAWGSTNILGPLGEAFARYSAPALAADQRAVIVITDGDDTDHGREAGELKARLKTAKGDTRTFVFWLGNATGAYLDTLADYSLSQQGDVGRYLSDVYGVFGEAYSAQRVLRPKACPAEAKP